MSFPRRRESRPKKTMEERQIIHNLKALQQIKADEQWKRAAKARILDATEPRKSFFWGFLPSFRLKTVSVPAFGLVMFLMGLFLFAGLTYISAPDADPELEPEIAVTEQGPFEEIKANLAEIEKTLTDTESLASPEKTGKIVEEVTRVKQRIKEIEETPVIAEESSEELEEIKNKTEVLTAQISQALEQNIRTTTADLAEELLQMLRTRSLTDAQTELFNQAEESYNEGNYAEALEKIFLLTENAQN